MTTSSLVLSNPPSINIFTHSVQINLAVDVVLLNRECLLARTIRGYFNAVITLLHYVELQDKICVWACMQR